MNLDWLIEHPFVCSSDVTICGGIYVNLFADDEAAAIKVAVEKRRWFLTDPSMFEKKQYYLPEYYK